MERRFALFLVLAFLVLVVHFAVTSHFRPPRPAVPQAAQDANVPEGAAAKAKPAQEQEEAAKPASVQATAEEKKPAAAAEAEPGKALEVAEAPSDLPARWVTLGSADPGDPYRMLVTLTSKGAAVARVELNSPRYHDLEDRSGYLGHVVMDSGVRGNGCPVQVVGEGTPAAQAGLKPGDVIEAIDGKHVTGSESLHELLEQTKPKRTIDLTVDRNGEHLTLHATLRRRPLELVKPENHDPLSLLLTLQRLDKAELPPEEDTVAVGKELGGLDLWSGNWELVEADQTHARFRRQLSNSGIEIAKTYRLVKVPADEMQDPAARAYHLQLEIEIRNTAERPHVVAYQLDGPNGLPTEGAWYAYTISRSSGAAGLRDLVVSFDQKTPAMVNCPAIAAADAKEHKITPWRDQPLTYIGVDGQYFAAVVMPQKEDPANIWFAASQPLRVGPVEKNRLNLTNTSFRLIGNAHTLAPGDTLKQEFTVFLGPKRPDLLAKYGLGDVVYYGWPIFAFFAEPLVKLLDWLHWIIPNYGVAIILLTVLVRGLMFPMSRKQAINAQKMQLLQPEIKRLQEKFKKDPQGLHKAQQELFQKHHYNPLSGCLPMFVQLPIFMGLYRCLMVDVELRQAPLLSESIRWCSNLAAPDMLYNWSWFMPDWVNAGVGMFALGPYFNLLPMLTIVLFLWQQKAMMPPAADEQAAMQQKVMQYMMIFMGVMFFKVASGLCIYFTASSLWGVAERKFLPKTAAPSGAAKVESRADAKARAREQAAAQRDAANDGARNKSKDRNKR